MGRSLRYGAGPLLHKGLLGLAAILIVSTGAVAQQITIAALGDSLTQGYGLPPEDGFVPQLQTWLQDQGKDVAILNAGVSGDTSAGGLARIAWTLSEDVDAVIVELGANDLLRGIDPSVTRENLDGILSEITSRGLPVLLAGIPAPGNYGPEYKTEFDAIFPELASTYDALLYENFLGGLAVGENLNAASGVMQSDGVHPNATGVSQIVADIGPLVVDLLDRAQP